MLQELKGYIGLSSEESKAESGLYVDALPDISLQVLENIANEDSEVTWSQIEDRAILKLRTLFIKEVNKCHKIAKIDVCECLITSNKEILATALWYLLGAEVMLTRGASSRINMATIDRNKPKELRAYFEEQFKQELATAVAGIDIHASDCIDEDVPANDVITFQIPVI
jgi:hypothetical protein